MKTVKSLFIATCFLLASTLAAGVALANSSMTLHGKQIAGSGHAKNARTESNRLVLTQPATVADVKGDAQAYCIWAAVTPQNRTASSVLCGGKGRPSIIGQTLGAGTYTVLPGLNGKSSASITITFK